MKFLTIAFVLLQFSITAFAQTSTITREPLVIGVNVEIFSEALNENRALNIYLPPSYHKDSADKFPVIYLLDGGMDEDFLHITGLAQFASFPWIQMIPESIVVGIVNVDRQRDFTFPTTNKKDKIDIPSSGQSQKFIQFLLEELQPFISEKYSNHPSKTLIGQSLGGLLASEVLFQKPNSFTNYVIVSPSLWWDDESFLQREIHFANNSPSIFIAVGKEGEVMKRTAKVLAEKLQNSVQENDAIFFEFLEKQDHGDALHLAVYHAFEKFSRK